MADQEKGKGFSLRKKRRQGGDGAPSEPSNRREGGRPRNNQREAQGATGSSNNDPNGNSTDPRVRSRPRPGGQTSDIVKKRYSIRYNALPDFSNADAPPMPGVPKIPQIFDTDGGRAESPAPKSQGVDLRALNDPSLEAEQCKHINEVRVQQVISDKH